MKIQIDTTAKTIRVEENINLNELMEAIKKLLPDNLWKKFSLETNVVIYWERYPIITYPTWPTYPPLPWIVTSDRTTYNPDVPCTLTTGTYNIEIGL